MANVVDFSQLRQKVTPWGEALLDPITEELQRRQKQADAEALIALKHKGDMAQQERLIQRDAAKAQHDREVERLNNDRFVGEQTIKEGDRRAATEEKIRQDIGRDDNYDAAEQRAKSYQSFDPKTGAVTQGLPGFKLDRGIAPGEPSPELSAVMGGEADAAMGAFPALAGAGVAAKEKRADQQVEYGYKQQHPDIMIAGVPTTRDALRYSAGRANAADLKRVEDEVAARLATSHDPVEISILGKQLNDLKVKRTAVENSLIKPGDALKGNDAVVAGERKQAGAEALQTQKGATTIEAAKIGAQGRVDAATAGAGARSAEKDKERASGTSEKAYARVQADLSTFDKQHNISKDRSEESRMATLLNNKDVTIVQRAMAGNLARGIGSERGVLTDKDISRLQGNLGGYWSDIENWLSKGATGDLSDDVKAKLVEGVQVVLAEKQKDRLAAEKAYERRFLNPTYVGHRWGFTDEINNAFEEKFGHPYQPSAAPASPGRPQRDPSNPDDPNAPDAGRPLDGDAPAAPTGRISREDAIREARRRGLIK